MAINDPDVIGGSQTMGGAGTTSGAFDDPTLGGRTPSTRDVKRKASEVASQAKNKAAELGRNTVDTLDRGIDSAAEALHSTASTLRSNLPQEGRVGQIATRAADTMERAGTYMREHDVRDMMVDIEGAVRRNPGPALAIAAAFGFLLGSALRGSGSRKTYY